MKWSVQKKIDRQNWNAADQFNERNNKPLHSNNNMGIYIDQNFLSGSNSISDKRGNRERLGETRKLERKLSEGGENR